MQWIEEVEELEHLRQFRIEALEQLYEEVDAITEEYDGTSRFKDALRFELLGAIKRFCVESGLELKEIKVQFIGAAYVYRAEIQTNPEMPWDAILYHKGVMWESTFDFTRSGGATGTAAAMFEIALQQHLAYKTAEVPWTHHEPKNSSS